MGARFNYTGKIQTSRSKDDCFRVLRELVKETKGTVFSFEGADLKARFGSQFWFRFLGAFLATDNMFPMIGSFDFFETDEGTTIAIQFEEDFGFGTLLGVETKYRQKVEKRKDFFEDELKARLG